VNHGKRLIAASFVAASTLAVWPVAAAPTKKECIAAINSGEDLRPTGKLLAARERFAICVATSCPSSLREDCGKRLAEVVQATPTIVFEAKDGAGNDLSSVHVTMDGEPLTDKLDGTAMPMDPGEHRFTFEVEGVPKNEKTIVVREGDRDRHERVVLGATPRLHPEDSGAKQAEASNSAAPAIVAFGVGGVGLVLGGIFAIEGLNAKSQADTACATGCPGDATSRNSTITTDTAVAWTGFAVAAAGAVVGVLLFPHAQPTTPQAGRQVFPILGPAFAGIGGRF
jgi:hypothetical protein